MFNFLMHLTGDYLEFALNKTVFGFRCHEELIQQGIANE